MANVVALRLSSTLKSNKGEYMDLYTARFDVHCEAIGVHDPTDIKAITF